MPVPAPRSRGLLACLLLAAGTAGSQASAEPKLVDAAHASLSRLGTAPGGGPLRVRSDWRPEALGFVRAPVGDSFLRHAVGSEAESVGLTPGPFADVWDLTDRSALRLHARLSGVENAALVLVDADGRRARHAGLTVRGDGAWRVLDALLGEFEADDGFRLDAVRSLRTAEPLPAGSRITLDGAHFTARSAGSPPLGITDLPYAQHVADAAATRQARVRSAYADAASARKHEQFLFAEFAQLWLGENLEAVNERLREVFTADPESELGQRYELDNAWSLWLSPFLCRTYLHFGPAGKTAPGRLEPETAEALLTLLWDRTLHENDIALARLSTWWMVGSENHDVNAKVTSLLSSQIFASLPAYRDRIYPDAGTGGGSGYWFHSAYGPASWKGPEGRADWSDGEAHDAADHRDAWTAFWKTYLRERVDHGFFLEVASSGYMKFTISFLQDLHDFSEDEELAALAGDFLDLVWAEWAIDQLHGFRGGSKTRWRDRPRDAMWDASRFHLGGVGQAHDFWYSIYASGYAWPEELWRLALDRKGKGSFAYASRKPGAEPPRVPRPAGLERTLMCDTDPLFVRYSWVTPAYVLGSQMDHPGAIHSHLSPQARWAGITFAATGESWISPCGITVTAEGTDGETWSRNADGLRRGVQHENVLLTQQARRWSQQNPDWYPAKAVVSDAFGVRFRGVFEEVVERDRWVFARVGDAYAGVRVLRAATEYDPDAWVGTGDDGRLAAEHEVAAHWSPDRSLLRFADPFSPVILHAGDAATHGGFADFQETVLAGTVELRNTVVPGWFIAAYTPANPDGSAGPTLVLNAANESAPSVGGEVVEYQPDLVLDSPFLRSETGSGRVAITVDGLTRELDFTSAAPEATAPPR